MQPCAHPAGQSREIAKRDWHHPGLAGSHLPHHALRRLSVGLAAAVLGSVLALGNITARPACAEEASTENVVAKAASAEPDVPAAVAVTDGSNPGVPVAAAEATQGEGNTAKAPVVGAAEGTTTSNVEASNSQPSKTEVPTVSPAPADTVASSARATRDGTPVTSDTQTDEETASAKALASPSVPASSSSSTSPTTDAGAAVSKNVSVAPTHAPSTETSAPTFGTPTSPDAPAATSLGDDERSADVETTAPSSKTTAYANVYRLFNPWTTEHLYTTDLSEAKGLASLGWNWEGIAWVTPSAGASVYRLYNAFSGDHLYTARRSEYDTLVKRGWRGEGVQFRSVGSKDGTAVRRLFNRYVTTGTHFLTTSVEEEHSCVRVGWKSEGTAWYAARHAPLDILGFWFDRFDGTRWWVDATGTLANSRVIDPTSGRDRGSGRYAYARASGSILRDGTADAGGGWSYLADNDGRLVHHRGSGWVVTASWPRSGRQLQRYWTQDKGSYSLVRHGIFIAKGETGVGACYLGRADTGYVVRGAWGSGTTIYLADNDGRLAAGSGWQVTGRYGQGLQRYYLYSMGSYSIARHGLSSDGARGAGGIGASHLTTNQGYVLRGIADAGDGWSYLADNDGRLVHHRGSGWVVTAAWPFSDRQLQRYWTQDKNLCSLVRVGHFEVSGSRYFGRTDTGYVLRNADLDIDGIPYHADNDGRLTIHDPMIARAQGYASSTDTLVLVDTTDHWVGVFRGSQGNWRLDRRMRCSTGAPRTPTVTGNFTVGIRGYSFNGSNYTCYYYTQFYKDYLFHSIVYHIGTFRVLDGRIGYSVSAGCVRLQIDNAKWIHDTVPTESTVITYR